MLWRQKSDWSHSSYPVLLHGQRELQYLNRSYTAIRDEYTQCRLQNLSPAEHCLLTISSVFTSASVWVVEYGDALQTAYFLNNML